MTEHRLHHEHCEEPVCYVCASGLASCEVCKGWEGSLPTECPGETMHPVLADEVLNGKRDYKDGRWFTLPQKGSD